MRKCCWQCKKTLEKIGEKISLPYKNHILTVNNLGKFCADCLKSIWERTLEKHPGLFYLKNEGEIGINWKLYSKIPEDTNAKTEIIRFLYALGIFSIDSEGNWEIVAMGPIGLNPRFISTLDFYLYFTRKEDAIDFARAYYSNSLYYWEIRQIGKVIPKSAVIF